MRYYSLVVIADSPQAYYQLDETSGTTATDSSGFANNGTYTGSGVTYGVAGAITNDADTAVTFDGTAGDMATPSGVNPSGWAGLSVEAWVKLTNITYVNTPTVCGNALPGSTNTGFNFTLDASGAGIKITIGNGSSNANVHFVTSLSAGVWYHLVATYGGSTIKLYVNGVQQGSVAFTGTIGTAAGNPTWGSNPASGGFFLPGTFDEGAIYNYALSQAQITSHYNAGLGTPQQNYYYGPFQINNHPNGVGYFLIAKDLDFPDFKPAISPLALYDGNKITGYQVGHRQIQTDIYIVGTSRTDCIARKDTLEAALAKRDQQLVLHEDGRYWVGNAISGKAKFAAGKGIVQVQVPVVFVCANPYAIAANAATAFDTGNVAYSTVVVAGTYQSPVFNVAGAGTIYSWPTLTLTHRLASPGSTTLNASLTSGNAYTSITVVSSPALVAGQVITLSWTTGGNTFVQKLTVSGTVTGGATSIPVNSFVASASFPITNTTVSISVAWNIVTINQITDNYQIQAFSSNDKTYEVVGGNTISPTSSILLPQNSGDSLTVYCDPTASNGWTITGSAAGVGFSYQPNGAFPPLEPITTQFRITITADNQPTAEFTVNWTPRYAS